VEVCIAPDEPAVTTSAAAPCVLACCGAQREMHDPSDSSSRRLGPNAGLGAQLGQGTSEREALELALQESEERFRALVLPWAHAVWETDASGLVVSDSPTWRAYTGLTLDDWLGHGWANAFHPDDRERALEQWLETVRSGAPAEAVFRLRAPGGEWRWTHICVAPVRNPDGTIRKWVGINIDVTEAKRREAHTAFLAEVTDDMARLWSADEIMEVVGAKIRAYLALASVDFVDVDEAAGVATAGHDQASQRAARAKETIVIRDARAEVDRGFAPQVGALVSVPFHRDGVWTSMLTATDSRPRDWRDDEIQLFRELAEWIFPRLERARAEEALRQSEDRQAFLLKLSDRMRALEDPSAIYAEACRLLGEYLHVNRLSYADIEGDEYIIWPGYANGVEPRPARRGRVETFGKVFLDAHRGGDSVVVEDVESDPRFTPAEREAYREARIAAFMAVILVEGDRWKGVFGANNTTPRRWTQGEIQLTRDVVDRMWAAVDRAHAEAALRVSEEQMRLAMQAASMYVWTIDLATGHATYSPNYADVVGFPPVPAPLSAAAVHEGRTFQEDTERLLEVMQKAARGEGEAHVEHRARDPETGAVVWLESHVTPIVDATTGTARIVGVARNISSRKRAEQALRESEERQAYLLALSDALRPLAEPAEIQSAASRILADHLGVSRVTYVEHHEDDETGVVHGAHSAHLAVPLIENGQHVATLTVNDTSPRPWTPLEISLVQETAERTRAAVERAHTEAALRRSFAAATAARAEAERANKAKDEFLATLGHELRTPLAAIVLWGGALRSGAVPLHELARAIDAIVQSAESQSRLIEDLLDLSRLTSGKLLLAPTSAEVESVARAAVDIVRPTAQAKGVALEIDIPGDLGTAILDAARFKQVLLNLLSNATKFTPEGGKVTLRVRRGGGCLEADVTDTGEGIAPEFMPHVFERFRQADMGETRQHAGLGIGLALSRHLIELQGGTIEAESEGPERGSTFRVRLPWVDPAREPLAQRAGAEAAERASKSALRGLTVLVVEDDSRTREAMCWTLDRAGATVMAFGSGVEVLAALDELDHRGDGAASAPDVVITDLGLPGMSGYELIQRIADRCRARGRKPLPGCAVSAHARDVDRQRAFAAGFDVYLTKPVTPERLLDAVEDLRAVAESEDV